MRLLLLSQLILPILRKTSTSTRASRHLYQMVPKLRQRPQAARRRLQMAESSRAVISKRAARSRLTRVTRNRTDRCYYRYHPANLSAGARVPDALSSAFPQMNCMIRQLDASDCQSLAIASWEASAAAAESRPSTITVMNEAPGSPTGAHFPPPIWSDAPSLQAAQACLWRTPERTRSTMHTDADFASCPSCRASALSIPSADLMRTRL